MREENKRVYYVAKPSKSEDEYGAVFNDGYNRIAIYSDLISDRRGESDDIEKFGAYDSQKMFIVHDDNDGATPDIALGDGVFIDALDELEQLALVGFGTVGHMVVGGAEKVHKPQYTVERVQEFRTKHIYTLTKAVDQYASNG